MSDLRHRVRGRNSTLSLLCRYAPANCIPDSSWKDSDNQIDYEGETFIFSPVPMPDLFPFISTSESSSPVVDPRTLCPFCDTRLPSSPTPTLKALIAHASKHKTCYPEPRPGNARGRRAPVQVFIGVCQRHRFESEILPEAERRGWPKTIEWGSVKERIEWLEAPLQAIIDDADGTPEGPRAQCVFWQEVLNVVKAAGSRALIGVRGQYSTFERIQPG